MQYSETAIDAQIASKRLFLLGDFDSDLLINYCTMQGKGIKPGTELWINSHGGSLSILFGLKDLISLERNITKIIGFGAIYSAAAYLLVMLPDRQQKFMTPNCDFMLHKVTAAAIGEHEFEHRNNFQSLQRSNQVIENYFKKAIQYTSKKEFKDLLERWQTGEDIYFTAEECLELNIVNGIMDAIEYER